MEQHFTYQLHHALSPALRTSLEVLAMPLPQLIHWLEERIEENPLLSLDPVSSNAKEEEESHAANEFEPQEEEFTPLREPDEQLYEGIFPEEIETYGQRVAQTPPLVEQRDLFEHLSAQARERFSHPKDLSLAMDLINQIDEKGYLPSSVQDSEILIILQSFDPPGITARSVRESLQLQLKRQRNPSMLALRLLENYYEDLLHQRIVKLCKKLECQEQTLRKVIRNELAPLSLAPGSSFRHSEPIPWIPDLIIVEEEGSLRVEIDQSLLPTFSFDPRYNNSSCETTTRSYLNLKRKEARIVQEALRKRSLTLLRLGKLLLKTQQPFFEGKENHPTPLSMEKAASSLKLHHSTISRAIAGKIISTPRGIIPLDEFFRHSKALPSFIERKMARLIQEEDKTTPLSDDAIAKRLKSLGFICSRRTVTKYRKALRIQTARLRKT